MEFLWEQGSPQIAQELIIIKYTLESQDMCSLQMDFIKPEFW